MSLLFHNSNEKVSELARKVYERHFELDPKLNEEYNDRQKRLMYNDILYNLEYLHVAMKFNDDKIFKEYAVWIYQLLCHLIVNLDRERIKDQMILHYEILRESLSDFLTSEEMSMAHRHLNNAIDATENECINFHVSNRFESLKYADIRKEYLNYLLNNDTKNAYRTIQKAIESGIPIQRIYIDVLQEVMYEVGNLWHQNKISIDKEHYCTSATQMILSQFYSIVFNTPKNARKVLSCCVENELHEMGIRMVSDLFDYRGWDSIYLGAAVPKEAILKAIGEHKPDLVALSVTMPQHLPICFDTVNAIREQYKQIKISVGGRAFQTTNELWNKWDVDICVEDVEQLIDWADKTIRNKGGVIYD